MCPSQPASTGTLWCRRMWKRETAANAKYLWFVPWLPSLLPLFFFALFLLVFFVCKLLLLSLLDFLLSCFYRNHNIVNHVLSLAFPYFYPPPHVMQCWKYNAQPLWGCISKQCFLPESESLPLGIIYFPSKNSIVWDSATHNRISCSIRCIALS